MTRLVVLTTDARAAGYRLAGVATHAARDAADAHCRLAELVVEGERGVVAVHEPWLRSLDSRERRRLEDSVAPLVVALPDDRQGAEDDRRARLLRVLAQAVGYEFTLGPEGDERS